MIITLTLLVQKAIIMYRNNPQLCKKKNGKNRIF